MHMQFFKTVLIVVGVALFGILIFAFSGIFDPAADQPHWRITYKALDLIRDRGIAARARDTEVPHLDDTALIRSGAGNYASMCEGCHLAPGEPPGEIQRGMYPAPPNLSKGDVLDAGRTFWIIKHGIKMSGMPAWGESMGDAPIWGMTAFVRQLPTMTAEQYKTLVAASGGHDHGDGNTPGRSEQPGQSNGTADEAGDAGMQDMESMEDRKDQHDGAAEEGGHSHGTARESPAAGMKGMEADEHDDAGAAPHSHSGAATDDPAETLGTADMDHGAMPAMKPADGSGKQGASTEAMDHSSMSDMASSTATKAPQSGTESGSMEGMDKSTETKAKSPGTSAMESGSTQGMDHSSMAGMNAPPNVPPPPHPVSGPAEAALQAFQDALQVGNRDLVMQWLASDVTIVEGGKTEPSREAYASHHMGSDMAFLKSSKVVLLDRRVQQSGDSARIESTSRITGSAGGKPVDIISEEIAQLENTADGWRIVRLEWSSEPVED